MQPFTTHTGLVAPLDRSNVDTDQIIPKQFLKRIERTGFGKYLFFDWRLNQDGSENPDFELNRPELAARACCSRGGTSAAGRAENMRPGPCPILVIAF